MSKQMPKKTVERKEALRAYMNVEAIRALDAQLMGDKANWRKGLRHVVLNKDTLRPGAVVDLKRRKRRTKAFILALVALNIIFAGMSASKVLQQGFDSSEKEVLFMQLYKCAALAMPPLAAFCSSFADHVDFETRLEEKLRIEEIEVVGSSKARYWRNLTYGALLALTCVNAARLIYFTTRRVKSYDENEIDKITLEMLAYSDDDQPEFLPELPELLIRSGLFTEEEWKSDPEKVCEFYFPESRILSPEAKKKVNQFQLHYHPDKVTQRVKRQGLSSEQQQGNIDNAHEIYTQYNGQFEDIYCEHVKQLAKHAKVRNRVAMHEALCFDLLITFGLGTFVGILLVAVAGTVSGPGYANEVELVGFESLAQDNGVTREELFKAIGKNWSRYLLKRATPSRVRADLASGKLTLK